MAGVPSSSRGSSSSGGVTVDNYTQFTSTVNVTATTAGTADTIVTAGAVTADGTSVYCIEFACVSLDIPSGAGHFIIIGMWDSGSEIGRFISGSNGGAGSQLSLPGFGRRYLTPSAAAHTFSIRGYTSASTTVGVIAGAGTADNAPPGYIRVTHGS